MKQAIINRYLLREIASIFVLGLTIFTLVLLMGRMLRLMEMVVTNGIPLVTVAGLIALLMPSFLVMTIPMATLLAVLLAFGRLSSDNEITIFKTCGISLTALLPPVLLVAALAAVTTLFISVIAVPWGNTGFKNLTAEVAGKYAATAISERIFRDDLPGIVLYLDHFDETRRVMDRVMIQDSRDAENPLTIFAKSGLISSDNPDGSFRILLKDGTIHTTNKNDYRLISFGEYLLTVVPEVTAQPKHSEKDLGIAELRDRIEHDNPEHNASLVTELHSRFAFPFAAFVFAILAVPLGLSNRRSGKGSGFTISIIILLCYYLMMTFLRTMAEKGQFPPVLAVWLPNVFFLVLGLVLLCLASREITLNTALGRLLPLKKGRS